MNLLLAALLACSTPEPPRVEVPRAVPTVAVEKADAYPFAWLPDGAALLLPPTTRPGNEPPPDTFHPVAPFEEKSSTDAYTVWSTPLPVDFHLFLQRQAGARTFGAYAPNGLEVQLDGEKLEFLRGAKGAGVWGYDQEHLFVGVATDAEAPTPERVTLRWPKATEVERTLHLGTSGLEPVPFALRTVVLGTTSHHGLLLPAPASAAWTVVVPPEGVLTLRGRVLPPAIRALPASDGATLRVELEVDGKVEQVAEQGLGDDWTPLRVDLSAHGGKRATVRFLADPGASSTLDLVFLEEPTLYRPKAKPRHLVVAFADTVRADHLGMYGYTRPTSPKLDAWAAGAVRFDDHRTIAPWTLPSTRAALTGHQPEDFAGVPTLAERLSKAGFATRAIVANAYLSQVFDVHRGFGRYDYQILQPAKDTVDQALAELDTLKDRDAIVLVQLMEAHLPYREPKAYRGLFAGEPPAGLKDVVRAELVLRPPDDPALPAIREYVAARYDQNLRVLDDQLSRLFEAAGPDAVTVLWSDHGEELWEHGGFEHGHAFWDELLRVPLVVKAPELKPGVVDVPTSLLDLTPTLLELAGVSPDVDGPGLSLVPAAKGDATVRQLLVMRPHGFGRPLYGDDGWGVVVTGRKWFTRSGEEHLFDLGEDPGEVRDRIAEGGAEAMPAELAGALAREVPRVWRVVLGRPPKGEATVTITAPGGVAEAWAAYDPKSTYEGVAPTVTDGVVTLTQEPGRRMPPVILVRPRTEALKAVGLEVKVKGGGREDAQVVAAVPPRAPNGRVALLSDAGPFGVTVDVDWAPVPTGAEVSAFHEEVEGALEALGYRSKEE